MSDDTPSCESSGVVATARVEAREERGDLLLFRKSMSRMSVGFTSVSLRSRVRLLIGSTTTTLGRKARTASCIITRCCSSPCSVGRDA